MIKRNYLYILILAFLLIPKNSFTQDKGEWLSSTIKFDLPKKFSFSVGEEVRLQNISSGLLNQFHTDAELAYKINRRLDVAFIYRIAQKQEDNNYFYSRHRFTTEISYDNNIKRLGFVYRMRYQVQTKQFKEDSFDEIPDKYLRNRIKLTYNIKKTPIEPYMSYEVYSPLNSYKLLNIDEYRIAAGARFPINKKNRLDAGLMFNKEYNTRNTTAIILVLGYIFSAN